jgi:hypothetical protein
MVERYVQQGVLHPVVMHTKHQRRGFRLSEVQGALEWRRQHDPDLILPDLIAMRKAGMSEADMAAITGMQRQTISQALRRAGVTPLEAWERAGAPAAFTHQQEQLVLGTVLGDAHLQRSAEMKYHAYAAEHSLAQRDYLYHKYTILQSFCHLGPVDRLDRKMPSVRFITMVHPLFSTIWEQVSDKHGGRCITTSYLSRMTAMALAYWYMDDGSITGGKASNSRAVVLYSYKLGRKQNEMLCVWFAQQWDIRATIFTNRAKSPGYDVALSFGSGQRGQRFLDLIAPHIVPSMHYKLDL